MGFQGMAVLRKAQGQGCSGGERQRRGGGSLEILPVAQPVEDCGPRSPSFSNQHRCSGIPAFLLALPAPGFLSFGLLALPLSRDP